MQQYLQNTQALVRQKKYKEALQRDIWFHNHALEHEPRMRGVRLSFALGYWERLGEVYSPAMTALKNTRDHKTKLVIKNNGSRYLFADVAAINRVLKEDAKTVSLFQLLAKARPDSAQQDFRYVKDQLLTAKRYDIIRLYIGDPVHEFDSRKMIYDQEMGVVKSRGITDPVLTNAIQDALVKKALQLIQYALAEKDMNDARQIQKKALLVVNDDRLKQAVR